MKKVILGVLVLSLLISLPVLAEENQVTEESPAVFTPSELPPEAPAEMPAMPAEMPSAPELQQPPAPPQAMMKDGKMCPMMKGGMCPMMKASMVAAGDGGVIVLMGNKLMKYDADLNLIKEAEIKIDMKNMPGMMGGKNCPMMKKAGSEVASDSETVPS